MKHEKSNKIKKTKNSKYNLIANLNEINTSKFVFYSLLCCYTEAKFFRYNQEVSSD